MIYFVYSYIWISLITNLQKCKIRSVMFCFFVQYNKTTYNVWVIELQYVEICSEFSNTKYIRTIFYEKQIISNILKCQNTKIMQLLSKYLICKFIYFWTSPEFKVQRFRFWFYTTETHCKNTNGHLMYLQDLCKPSRTWPHLSSTYRFIARIQFVYFSFIARLSRSAFTGARLYCVTRDLMNDVKKVRELSWVVSRECRHYKLVCPRPLMNGICRFLEGFFS